MISVDEKVLARIRRLGPGACVTAKDFLDRGSRASVDHALSILARQGDIRRVCRGVYEYPKQGKLIPGPMPPDFDQVGRAIARSTGTRIQPAGAVAANLLGVSEQVPARILYLTDGLSRTLRIDSRTIQFKRVRSKELLANEKSALVVQALRFVGRESITDDVLARIRRVLTSKERHRLLKDAQYTSDWIADAARRIAEEPPHG